MDCFLSSLTKYGFFGHVHVVFPRPRIRQLTSSRLSVLPIPLILNVASTSVVLDVMDLFPAVLTYTIGRPVLTISSSLPADSDMTVNCFDSIRELSPSFMARQTISL